MQYITDPWSLWRDKSSKETRRLRPREANIQSGAAAARFIADCRKQGALQGVPVENIRVVQELIAEYGMK